jgi:hypothetical protein
VVVISQHLLLYASADMASIHGAVHLLVRHPSDHQTDAGTVAVIYKLKNSGSGIRAYGVVLTLEFDQECVV